MKPIQFLLLAFVLGALAKVIHSYRQRRLVPLDFLFWGLVWLGTASIIIFPDATSFVAHLLGIGRGADLIVYLSLLISFYLIFRLYVALARLEHTITALVSAIALEQLSESVNSAPGHGE
jgi:small membrane protein